VLRFRLMMKRGPWMRPQEHQKEKRSMDHFAGLDVSVKDTSVCVVDEAGKIMREVKVASEPDGIVQNRQQSCLPLQADWTGSWTFVAVAAQRRLPKRACR
jgi:hypothetical protein